MELTDNKADILIADDVIDKGGRGSAKNTAKKTIGQRRFDLFNLRTLIYTPRVIHQIMGESSHNTMAHHSAIVEQEKFRADPRFSLFEAMKRNKRYQDIFNGIPYRPIFG